MDVKNCKYCGKIFQYIGGSQICQQCKKDLEVKFKQVKHYLYEHPNMSIQKTAEDNQVSIHQLNRWVREERLRFATDSGLGIECEICGKTINTGRFCPKCKIELVNEFKMSYEEFDAECITDSQKNQAKMRYFNQFK